MLQETELDLIIIGGGISGLWALNRLSAAGYRCILMEAQALGAGQTLKSQGIIHGGLKYALAGALTGASTALESMPARWKACLAGQGEIDLQTVKILSSSQLLWSTGHLSSDMMSFMASKTLRSRVQKLDKSNYPTLLQDPKFKGQVYRLEEIVLDVPSLLQTLASPYQDRIFKGAAELVFSEHSPNRISHLRVQTEQQTVELSSQRYLFTAGAGNELFIHCFKNEDLSMQRRPLHMVLVKWKNTYPYAPFFGHCLDKGLNPRITITSHLTRDQECVWYLGGDIAEEGIHRNSQEQIEAAKKELETLFPWIELSSTEWSSFRVDRAEINQPNGKRPDSFSIKSSENWMMAWPTKLALAPLLSDAILEKLEEQKISRSLKDSKELGDFKNSDKLALGIPLERVEIAAPIWETAFHNEKFIQKNSYSVSMNQQNHSV